ncbi:hypothetical protein PanWU01x14_310760 [Parasponia andersonii]|uniref:Uncharacterized protein n=1 Tax=Parasponia andersonii TaxID=3476 RepID=A0A2P5AQ37_PARAD|nr:hypothetical protein PanWU01x14_310760 [Parasponia andersonii]
MNSPFILLATIRIMFFITHSLRGCYIVILENHYYFHSPRTSPWENNREIERRERVYFFSLYFFTTHS